MGGGGTTYQMPQQPSYGEGMADAMKAQMQQLLGQGEYADIYADAGFEGGNLGDIIQGVDFTKVSGSSVGSAANSACVGLRIPVRFSRCCSRSTRASSSPVVVAGL